MHISLFIISIIFFVVFYVTARLVYQKKNAPEKYDIRNHFAYELWIKKDSFNAFIDVFLFLSVISFAVNFSLYAIYNFSIFSVISAVVALLVSFSVVVLFYLPLSKLKERCIFSIIFFVSVTILNALMIYHSFTLLRQYGNNLIYISVVFSALIDILGIIIIFNPKIFDFSMSRDQEGLLVRPKIISLAFFEWLLVFFIFFSQISILFM